MFYCGSSVVARLKNGFQNPNNQLIINNKNKKIQAICNQWVGGSSPSVGTIKKASQSGGFFMVLIFLGLEPKRARTDRKHRCSGVFVVSGKSLLSSKQTFVTCARHTNRTPQAPLPALQKKFCRFNQSRKIFSRFKLIFKHFYTILKTDI